MRGGFTGIGWSRSLRHHGPIMSDLLEDLYDRTAEECALFDNVSEVNKYSISCTECLHFSAGCVAPEDQVPGIASMLRIAYEHDGQAWDSSW